MKRIALTSFLFLSMFAAQAADPAQEQQLLALVKELQAQQVQMAENQAKIEAKLAIVADAVRIARIYSSRGGGGK